MDQTTKFLVALDFDNTIISHSRVYKICVQGLFPEGILPDHLEEIRLQKGWDEFLKATYKELFKQGATKQQILDCFAQIPFIEGMEELIREISENHEGEIIIISDGHDLFIEHILKVNGLDQHVKKVFANESRFTDDGEMIFPKKHVEVCKISKRNICKGTTLQKYIEERKEQDKIEFDFVTYVGDSSNDLCPSLGLDEEGMVFARMGFELAKCIGGLEEGRMKAEVCEWKDGKDVLQGLRRKINNNKLTM